MYLKAYSIQDELTRRMCASAKTSRLLTPGLDNTRLFMSLTAGAGTRFLSLLSSSPNLFLRFSMLGLDFLFTSASAKIQPLRILHESSSLKLQRLKAKTHVCKSRSRFFPLLTGCSFIKKYIGRTSASAKKLRLSQGKENQELCLHVLSFKPA